MPITIGIDPGVTGAIAAVRDGTQLVYLADMPTLSESKTGKVSRSVNGYGVSRALKDIIALCPGEHFSVCLERTSAMPGQGVASMYSMGHSRGVVEGVVCAKDFPLTLVRPALWKKKSGYTSDKEFIRGEMQRLFPGAELHLKKHTDRAEAIALAVYLHKELFK